MAAAQKKNTYTAAEVAVLENKIREQQAQIEELKRKLRTQIAESALPQLVPLESPAVPEERLCIQYRGAELKLPAGVDMDAVAAILRSLQSL